MSAFVDLIGFDPETDLNIKPCPAPGAGVHSWVFHAACRCVEAGLSGDEGVDLIESLMTREANPPTEIEDALRSARGERGGPRVLWPSVNDEQIEAITQHGPRLLDFWDSSPFKLKKEKPQTEEVIDVLYPRGNPWLCAGLNNENFCTQRRDQWRGRLHKYALIVPSPMTSRTGRTKAGYKSFHSLANTGPRRYLIVESDRGSLDQQAAVIDHLRSLAPLAAVVFSGSKSLHSWFFCAGTPEETLLAFIRYAVSLGADKRMWLRSQFCRMPDGRRSDGKRGATLSRCGLSGIPEGRQAVIYLDPEVIT